MTQTTINYAKALYKSNVAEEDILKVEKIFKNNPLIIEILSNPIISSKRKINAVKRIFDKNIWSFIIVLIKNNVVDEILNIIKYYKELSTEEEHVLKAKIFCVNEPNEARKNKIIAYLKKKYNTDTVKLKVVKDNSLIGGFIIQTGDFRLDMSLATKLNELSKNL